MIQKYLNDIPEFKDMDKIQRNSMWNLAHSIMENFNAEK